MSNIEPSNKGQALVPFTADQMAIIKAYAYKAAAEVLNEIRVELAGFKQINEVELSHINRELAEHSKRIFALMKDEEDEDGEEDT